MQFNLIFQYSCSTTDSFSVPEVIYVSSQQGKLNLSHACNFVLCWKHNFQVSCTANSQFMFIQSRALKRLQLGEKW